MTEDDLERRLARSLRRQADWAETQYRDAAQGRHSAIGEKRLRSAGFGPRALPYAAAVVILSSGLTLWGVSQLRPANVGTTESATPSESVPPSVSPAEVPTASPETPVQEFVEVTGGGIPAFAEPSVTSPEVDRIAEGRAVWAESQLVLAEGDAWLRVQFPSFAHGGQEMFAWVQDEAPAVVDLSCPPTPEVAALGAMIGQEHLVCFADDELRIVGFAIDVERQSPAYNGSPAWLAELPSFALRGSAEEAGDTGQIGVHVDPEAGIEVPTNTWVEVVGHFDDPQSSTCERHPATSGVTVETQVEQRLYCRQRFVLSEVAVVDPPVFPTPAPDPAP